MTTLLALLICGLILGVAAPAVFVAAAEKPAGGKTAAGKTRLVAQAPAASGGFW